jgi:hypothetical protein
MGVNDPGLLLRAAAIDKAADELIAQASEASTGHGPEDTGPARQQRRRRRDNAAQLADNDLPHSASKDRSDPKRTDSGRSPMFSGSQETKIPRAKQR